MGGRATLVLNVAVVLLAFSTCARAAPAIWVVQSATAKVYLFGTMHILPQKADWFGGKIETAFHDSAGLMEEADVGLNDPQTIQRIMAEAVAPDEDIWSKLSAADAARFRTEVAKCGLPDEVVAHFKPWFASMLPAVCALMSAGGTGLSVATSSPEAALLERAKAGGKTIGFFETAEQQIGYLSAASEAVQVKELQSAIEDDDNKPDEFNGMETSWLAGDVPAIARLVSGMRAKGADVYDVIFVQRNQRFAARIADLLKGRKTVFVAVGAGHLAGPDSVQAQLAKMGVQATRL